MRNLFEFSEHKPICGIYRIVCRENGWVYIGSSVNLWSRWHQHLECLHKGTHTNKRLQDDFNKFGPKSFYADLVAVCAPSKRMELESLLITGLDWAGAWLYNQVTNHFEPLFEGSAERLALNLQNSFGADWMKVEVKHPGGQQKKKPGQKVQSTTTANYSRAV